MWGMLDAAPMGAGLAVKGPEGSPGRWDGK